MSPTDVLIVNYLTGDLVQQAVDALAGAPVRLHVWDNSGELPPAMSDKATIYGDGRNHLFAAPNNRMFNHADGEHVLLLNPDVILSPYALAHLTSVLEADPEAWGVMPRLVGSDGRDQNYLRRLPTLRALFADRFPPLRWLWRRHFDHYYCREVDLGRDQVVEQPPAACLLIRRSAVDGALFDEGYPLFFNDVDLSRRLNRTGHCRYVASASALHVGGASISRARVTRRAWLRSEYDRSLLRYARRNLTGGYLLTPVILLRLGIHRLRARKDTVATC